MKVVKDNLHSRKCAISSVAEPAGDCMESSNSIYISCIRVGRSFSQEQTSHTSCILYFFLARRRHLRIDPKCPNIDPRPKLAKAVSRIVIELNPRCSMCDSSPICEKARRPIIRSDRERAFVKHLVEREIRLRLSCSRLLNGIGGLGDISGFDINGSSARPWGGGLWEFGRDDGIIGRRSYAIGETVESESQESRWRALEI